MRSKTLKRAAAFATAVIMSLGTISVMPEGSLPQFSFTAFAETTVVESGQCGDNVFYELDSNGTLTISGSGDMWDYGAYDTDSFFYDNLLIKNVIINNGVTSIGNNTFYVCAEITNVSLPDSITRIGENVFSACSNIENITLPDNTETIGSYAFAACQNLKSVTIPDSVTSIAEGAFTSCIDLTIYGNAPSCAETYAMNNRLNFVSINGEYTTIESGQCGENAFFEINSIGTLTISGTGDMWDYDDYDSSLFGGNVDIKKVVIEEGITKIGNCTFEYCYDITETALPNSLLSIGEEAFRYTSSLENINIPDSVTSIGEGAFFASGIKSIVIPNGITCINDDTFSMSDLITVTLPDSLVTIGEDAFSLTNIVSITLPESVKIIDNYAFFGCDSLTSINIPEGVTSLNDGTFSKCGSLKTVNLPESITDISSVFSECTGLENITIPSKVTNLKNYAFDGCVNLKTITIPSSVVKIDDYAFENCDDFTVCGYSNTYAELWCSQNNIPFTILGESSNIIDSGMCGEAAEYTLYEGGILIINGTGSITDSPMWVSDSFTPSDVKKIIINEGITEIGNQVFKGYQAQEIILPSGLVKIGKEAFYNCIMKEIAIPDTVECINNFAFYNCYKLEHVVIPDSVTFLGAYAFEGCDNLKSVVLSKQLTSIESYCFNECENLTYVEIPDSVVSIERDAFARCSNLNNITLPAYIQSIGYRAFADCEQITSIAFPESVSTIDSCAFEGCSNLQKVFLPSGIKVINSSTFCDCAALQEINIPNTAEKIGSFTFKGCTSLSKIYIPNSVTSIGTDAFKDTPVTIYCNTNSYAGLYAEENNIPYVLNETNVLANGMIEDFSWTLYEDNTLVISGTGKMPDINWEYSYSWDDYKYIVKRVVFETGITYIGDYTMKYFTNLEEASLCDGIEEIGDAAFLDCKNLRIINFPDSLLSLGERVFSGCSKLENVNLNNVMSLRSEVFYNTGIKKITIPQNLGYINIEKNALLTRNLEEIVVEDGNENYSSFGGCLYNADQSKLLYVPQNMKSIEFASTISSIGKYAFYNVEGLTEIVIPESITTIDERAFSGCNSSKIIISSNVTSIGYSAFSYCRKLTSITIPDKVTSIGSFAFEGCTGLKSITIPDSVTSIGSGAFNSCSSLTSITIPDSVTSIRSNTFNFCSSLTCITIPNSVTSIARDAFYESDNVTIYGYTGSCAEEYANLYNIPFVALDGTDTPSDPTETPLENFEIVRNYDDQTNETYKIIGYEGTDENVVIPAKCEEGDITSIYQYVFSGNTVKSVTVSKNITDIDSAAFSNAAALENIYVNENNTAFKAQDGILYNYNMTKLLCYPEGKTETEFVVPDSVTAIGNLAFSGAALEKITIGKNVTEISANTFFFSDITIYGYKNSYAETYANEKNIPFVALDGGNSEDPAPDPDPCEHTYATTYSYDASGHWYECTKCHKKQIGSQSAHSFGDSVVTKEPTETETGISTATCKYCGYVKKTTLPNTSNTIYVNEGESYTATALDAGKDIVVNGGTLTLPSEYAYYSFGALTVNSGNAYIYGGKFRAIGVNSGSLSVSGDVTVNESVYVVGGEGKLFGSDVKGGTMNVSAGSLSADKLVISEYGVFNMSGGVVDVSFLELSTKYTDSTFTGGTLRISTSFKQKNKAFRAAKNHTTIFDSNGWKIFIDVNTDDVTFGNLYLMESADVHNNLKNIFYRKNILSDFMLCSGHPTKPQPVRSLEEYLRKSSEDSLVEWEKNWTTAVADLFDSYSDLTIDAFDMQGIQIIDKNTEEDMAANVAFWSSIMKSEVARKTRDYSTANVILFKDIDIKYKGIRRKANFYFCFSDALGAFKPINGIDLNYITYQIYIDGIEEVVKGNYSISAGTNQYEFAKSCMKCLADGCIEEIENYLNIPGVTKTTTQKLIQKLIAAYFAYDKVDSSVTKAQAAMTLINPVIVSSWEEVVKCPVDVYVYDENDILVASVINNEVYDESDDVIVYVDGDAKYIHGFRMGYTVKIIGNGSGTMDFEYNKYNDDYILVRHTEYDDLLVTPNYKYTSEIVTCNSGILTDNTSKILIPDELYSEVEHHLDNVWKYNSTSHWHECSCGDKTDVGNHISDNGIISNGVRTYSCTVCGYVIRTETIPATDDTDYPTYPTYTIPVIYSPIVFSEKVTVKAEPKDNTVTIKWDEVEDADKYIIYQYKNGKYVKVKETTKTSIKFTKLKNGQTYKFLVRYTIDGKLSPTAYSSKFTVTVYYKPIAKATATQNSVKLNWKAVDGAEKYAIYKYVDGKAVKLSETEKLAVNISKLKSDTEYKYIVRAYVDGKWTTMTKSDIVTVKTKTE